MSRVVAWIKADLAKVPPVGVTTRTVRRYPQILAYGALHFALALGVLVGVLALLGRLDLVDDLMGIPVVYGGTRGGAMVQRLRVDSRRSSR